MYSHEINGTHCSGCHVCRFFPTQGSNPGLLHCRWILYCLSHPGSPFDCLLLLLLLSHFSCVRLCVTPQTAAHQAPLSLGFSRQEHWSGLPFPSPMHKSEREVAQSCPTLSDPLDCSFPGSSVHGIFQARVLEWGAIAFSVITLNSGKRGKNSIIHKLLMKI